MAPGSSSHNGVTSGLAGRRKWPSSLGVQFGLGCRYGRLLGRLSFFCWSCLFRIRLFRSWFGRWLGGWSCFSRRCFSRRCFSRRCFFRCRLFGWCRFRRRRCLLCRCWFHRSRWLDRNRLLHRRLFRGRRLCRHRLFGWCRFRHCRLFDRRDLLHRWLFDNSSFLGRRCFLRWCSLFSRCRFLRRCRLLRSRFLGLRGLVRQGFFCRGFFAVAIVFSLIKLQRALQPILVPVKRFSAMVSGGCIHERHQGVECRDKAPPYAPKCKGWGFE